MKLIQKLHPHPLFTYAISVLLVQISLVLAGPAQLVRPNSGDSEPQQLLSKSSKQLFKSDLSHESLSTVAEAIAAFVESEHSGATFDTKRLNHRAIKQQIENDLKEWEVQNRKGRSWIPWPRFFSESITDLGLNDIINSVVTKAGCQTCVGVLTILRNLIESKKEREEIVSSVVELCKTTRVANVRVCQNVIEIFYDEITYLMRNIVASTNDICNLFLGDPCKYPNLPFDQWSVTFPPVPKPPVTPFTPAKNGLPTMRVVHISDTHYDPYYKEGSLAECEYKLCCRESSGTVRKPEQRAGKWGDYRMCDAPKKTIDHILQHVTNNHKDIDYIIWTGDLPPHDIWNQTKSDNLRILKETSAQMREHFPNLIVYPALGNHESYPVNSFPPPKYKDDFDMSWFYDKLDEEWRHWLPKDTSATIKRAGYFSTMVKPKLKILSLNMNFCNNKNWLLLMNTTDPAQELQWLIRELQQSEYKKEKVHILGHIPPGHADCLKRWSENYYKIINRYESTVAAQFFGHTHFDEFEIFYDEQNTNRPTNIAYIGASLTPYEDLNPGYRIYTIDGDHPDSTWMVLDHENWIFDLDASNKDGNPQMKYLYNAKEAYKMTSLIPQEWDYLVHRMMNDDALFEKYNRYYWKSSPTRPKCNKSCRRRMLCDLVSGKSNDKKVTCARLKELHTQSRADWKTWMFNGMTLIASMFILTPLAMSVPSFLGIG